ncbi:hypothetical protein HYU95_04650 [Candidatus Daviesbacteria bacterium]|nr:hypothetical protein [Candidatus Daviesbacteria bacterium]
MAGSLVEAAVNRRSQIFSRRIAFCEVVKPSDITSRLEFTRADVPVEGVTRSLLASISRSDWFSIEGGRIYIEVRNLFAFSHDSMDKLRVIKGVDFDDCLASATRWHRKEQELMEQHFGIPLHSGKALYEASKIMVPGKAVGEKRYTPRLNLALLTAYRDLIERRVPEGTALDEATEWAKDVAELVKSRGEIAIARQVVDPQISEVFYNNRISRFLYQDFAGAVFNTKSPAALGFIATRGKIEGSLGQVYKIHTSGVLKRSNVDMVIYTNDIKAETLLHLSNLLPGHIKKKAFYLFDDNVAEIVPYLETADSHGMSNVWVVQVCHPDAKRKNDKVDLEPVRIVGRPSNGGPVLNYFTTERNIHSSYGNLFFV